MKESFWGVFIILMGIACLFLIYFFQDITTTDEHNFNLMMECTEGAMIDAVDLIAYRDKGIIQIDREKFVENFLRRFAENASLGKKYTISIYDVNEYPPKVSLKVKTHVGGMNFLKSENVSFRLDNKLDAILETPY
ncbi:MAG: hypothetical protein IJ565_03735 [Bacilli bacterium]|nr:hypothetical protein [Bacilli bacterium]